ncbi:hypothetical protein E1193_00775 [Micromonospora sp. KC606]|uniref:hypothetical protein n=1 Tax=Micromonospora sp. KC606 TaxID=2530379 RepID=UPI00104CFEF5|nr:hypothetical protein [Micromonospora sp. KC606]TDC86211.1 hypothetical protein E1193_00775 [Micromonospora sp. KC606]
MVNRRIITWTVTGAAALALAVSQATPALAATTVSVKTTDGMPIGGTAIFWGNNPNAVDPDMRKRERLGACDKQGNDGKIVYAEAQWKLNGQWQFFSLYDTNGAGTSGCREAWLPNIKEGTTVHIKACLQTSVNHRQEYCGTATGIA